MANLQSTTVTGTLNATGQYSQGGSAMISIVQVTPSVTNFAWSSYTNTSVILNPSGISASARYIFCDVFMTASFSDHQNFVFSRAQTSAVKTWVDSRGQDPTGHFGNLVATEVALITYHGESDGYTPNYGIWYPNMLLPSSGRTVWVNNHGNSGSSGYLYFVVKGYSI